MDSRRPQPVGCGGKNDINKHLTKAKKTKLNANNEKAESIGADSKADTFPCGNCHAFWD